jgi:hypothetical protein
MLTPKSQLTTQYSTTKLKKKKEQQKCYLLLNEKRRMKTVMAFIKRGIIVKCSIFMPFVPCLNFTTNLYIKHYLMQFGPWAQ